MPHAFGDEPGSECHRAAVEGSAHYDKFCSPEAVDFLFHASGAAAMPAVLAVWFVQLLAGLWNPVPE
jgi:hypothetical protein